MSSTTEMQIELDHFVGLALAAVVNGLREGGEVGQKTIDAIEAKFRVAADRCEYRGEVPNTRAFQRLADAVRDNDPGFHVIP